MQWVPFFASYRPSHAAGKKVKKGGKFDKLINVDFSIYLPAGALMSCMRQEKKSVSYWIWHQSVCQQA